MLDYCDARLLWGCMPLYTLRVYGEAQQMLACLL